MKKLDGAFSRSLVKNSEDTLVDFEVTFKETYIYSISLSFLINEKMFPPRNVLFFTIDHQIILLINVGIDTSN